MEYSSQYQALGEIMIQIQLDEILPVGILPKNLATLYPSANDMMQGTWGIDEGLARHAFYL
jgi:hypothetical protein